MHVFIFCVCICSFSFMLILNTPLIFVIDSCNECILSCFELALCQIIFMTVSERNREIKIAWLLYVSSFNALRVIDCIEHLVVLLPRASLLENMRWQLRKGLIWGTVRRGGHGGRLNLSPVEKTGWSRQDITDWQTQIESWPSAGSGRDISQPGPGDVVENLAPYGHLKKKNCGKKKEKCTSSCVTAKEKWITPGNKVQ